jgi:hypothetical protein
LDSGFAMWVDWLSSVGSPITLLVA